MIAFADTAKRWNVMVRYFDDITGRVALVRRNVEGPTIDVARKAALSTIPDGIGDVLLIDRARS